MHFKIAFKIPFEFDEIFLLMKQIFLKQENSNFWLGWWAIVHRNDLKIVHFCFVFLSSGRILGV